MFRVLGLSRRVLLQGAADFVFGENEIPDAQRLAARLEMAVFRCKTSAVKPGNVNHNSPTPSGIQKSCKEPTRMPFPKYRQHDDDGVNKEPGEKNVDNNNNINNSETVDAGVLCRLDGADVLDDPISERPENISGLLSKEDQDDLLQAHADVLWRFLPQKVMVALPGEGPHITESDGKLGPYRLIEMIGKGSFGSVFRAVRTHTFFFQDDGTKSSTKTSENKNGVQKNQDNILSDGAAGCSSGRKSSSSNHCSGEANYQTILQNEEVALKVMEKKSVKWVSQLESIYRECCIMSHLRHPNIVRILAVVHSPRKLAFVLEFVKGVSLFQWMHADQVRKSKGRTTIQGLKNF